MINKFNGIVEFVIHSPGTMENALEITKMLRDKTISKHIDIKNIEVLDTKFGRMKTGKFAGIEEFRLEGTAEISVEEIES